MPRQVRDRPLTGGRPTPETAWQHAPRRWHIAPTQPRRVGGSYRGIGPRGYRRSPERIYEDICDRLTDNPFIDASDVEVRVGGPEVTLTGSVDSEIALEPGAADRRGGGRRQPRAQPAAGPHWGGREATPGDRVNRAMGTTAR